MNARKPDSPWNRADWAAPHTSPGTPAEDVRATTASVSWGAVLAGVVLGMVTQVILNMLGIGIGAATLDPATGNNLSVSSFSLGAGIWFAVGGVVAALVGGYAAGRLSGQAVESTAGWHGLSAWALSTLMVLCLLTTAVGGLFGGSYRAIGGVFSGTASRTGATVQTAAQVTAPNMSRAADPLSSVERSFRSASGGNDPAVLRDAAVDVIRATATGDRQKVQQAREQSAQAIAKAQNIPEDHTRAQVQNYEEQYRQTVEQAKEQTARAADAAAKAVSRVALFGAISFLLGGVAAWFGGRLGAVDPTITAARFKTTTSGLRMRRQIRDNSA
jgi:hypothetical protein